MHQFEMTSDKFIIDGKEEFLLCGEIHYFRISKEYWSTVLDRLKESGCNAVAYYVPWFVHEYEEGKFDFCGQIHPDNDLHDWIRLTKEKGFLGILRPGPYVYAESADLGIPKWFIEKYPNTQVKKYENGIYKDASMIHAVSHNHPDFLKEVSKWYTAVCQEIKEDIYPAGNIILLQLCNEIPGDDYDDRNKENLGIGKEDGIYPSYLKSKYQQIDNLNKVYGTDFFKFEEVEPHLLEAARKELADRERLEFYYTDYYPRYFDTLHRIMLDNGIRTGFIHNAYNPRAISLHYHNRRKNPWLTVGVDCYYSLAGQLNMKEASYYCEYGAEYLKAFLHNVPWVIEQECGYWNDYPYVYGPELYIWNIWTFSAGYRGMNMYLFASGINRPGMGFFGTDHNWQAPVNEKGERKSSFKYIRKSIEDIKRYQDVFLSENLYDIGFGIKNEPGLIWKKIAKPTNEAYFALKSAGFTPKIYDFEELSLEELMKAEALFIVSDETMDREVQEKLCGYIEAGGRLIINGIFPYQNRRGDACTILADSLKLCVEPAEIAVKEQEKMMLEGVEYYIGKKLQPLTYTNAILHAQGTDNKPAALECRYGKGTALILPFPIEVSFHSMAEAVRILLKKIGVNPTIKGVKMLRLIPKTNGDVIVLNLHPVPVKEKAEINFRTRELSLEPYSFTVVNAWNKDN